MQSVWNGSEKTQITGHFTDHLVGHVNGNREEKKHNKVSLNTETNRIRKGNDDGGNRINASFFEALDARLNALHVITGTIGTF